MNTKVVVQKAVLLLAGLAVATGVWSAAVSAQPPANQVAGYWLIEGTPDPASGLAPFVNLATLTQSGEIINVDPGVGTSVGGWARLGGRQYAVTFTGFLPGGDGSRYVVRATATLDQRGSHLWGPYRTDFLTPDGVPFFTHDGTVRAWRQAVAPY
jgi:hypothetical protein